MHIALHIRQAGPEVHLVAFSFGGPCVVQRDSEFHLQYMNIEGNDGKNVPKNRDGHALPSLIKFRLRLVVVGMEIRKIKDHT